MDKAYFYDEEDREEGLTFKKVGYFFKKGWLRMIVYALVLLLVASVIVLPIKFFYKSEEIARSSIEFVYEGIEEGLDPNGGTLNTDNIISTTVLSKAVDTAELSDIITDISALRSAMRVDGVETDEYVRLVQAAADGDAAAANTLRTYKMYPTRFNIIISEPSKLGLNDDQAKNLLSNVFSAYTEDLKNRFVVIEPFTADMYTLSDDDTWEYADIYDIYVQSLDPIETYLNQLLSKASSFTSTANDTTFATLISNLSVILRSYDVFNNYILSNNVWRDVETAKINLAQSIESKTKELEYESAYADTIKAIIDNIRPNVITTTVGGQENKTEEYPEEYYEWLQRSDAQNSKIKSLSKQLSDLEIRLDRIADVTGAASADSLATAARMLKDLEATTMSFVEKVNAVVSDYYDTTFVSSSVRQVLPPIVTRKTSSLNIMVIYLCVAIVGVLAGAIVTCVKITKRASAEQALEAGDNTEQVGENADVSAEDKTTEKVVSSEKGKKAKN